MDTQKQAAEAVENARLAVSEGLHRAVAEAEHKRRDVAGKDMTPGQHLESVTYEAKNVVAAESDHLKREGFPRP